MRAQDIFIGRLPESGIESRKIPIIFMENTESYHNFEVRGNVATKRGGTDYQQILFDHVLPSSGTHTLTMHVLYSKRSYIWMGITDVKGKDKTSSFQGKNTIAFSLHSGIVASNRNWSNKGIGKTETGLEVRMEVNMSTRTITWFISDERKISNPIHKRISKLSLVPYVEIMEDNDEVGFED